jgi:hypothetical protein
MPERSGLSLLLYRTGLDAADETVQTVSAEALVVSAVRGGLV